MINWKICFQGLKVRNPLRFIYFFLPFGMYPIYLFIAILDLDRHPISECILSIVVIVIGIIVYWYSKGYEETISDLQASVSSR